MMRKRWMVAFIPKLAVVAFGFGILSAPALAETPTERVSAAIQAMHFAEPLVRAAPTTNVEDQALLQALVAHGQRVSPEDRSSLTAFLSLHPDSGWAPAIWTNLGLSYLHEGRFSLALEALQKAWETGKGATARPA